MRRPPSKDKDTDTPSLIADMEVNHNLTLGFTPVSFTYVVSLSVIPVWHYVRWVMILNLNGR